MKALALYAGAHVLSYVLSKGERALVPSQESIMGTMMFLDPSLSSLPTIGVDPGRMPEWHQRYLSLISEEILGSGGTLDSIVAESVSAWWGGTDPRASAAAACKASVSIVRGIGALNGLAEKNAYPRVLLRIGIASGPLAVGPYGSPKRLRFGVLGNAVNTANRLCSIAQPLDASQILISDETRALLPPSARSEKKSLRTYQEPTVTLVNVLHYYDDATKQ
jgi:class 3 adenylate cyclase